jgi:hypothetical protein
MIRFLVIAILALLPLTKVARAQEIRIYAGAALPAHGLQASTQFIDSPSSVAADGFGGLPQSGATGRWDSAETVALRPPPSSI